MKKLILIMVLALIIPSGCSRSDQDDQHLDEIRRLAGENIKLRQEQAELRRVADEFENYKITAEENLRFARMTQAELLVEFSNENMTIIRELGEEPSLRVLFMLGRFGFKGSNAIEYGGMVYDKIIDMGMDDFIHELSQYSIEITDGVTESLYDYVRENQMEAQILQALNEAGEKESILEAYIITRLKALLSQ